MAYSGLPYGDPAPSSELGSPTPNERMPPFYRVDLRLEKRWRFGDKAALALVFEWMNATLNKEVLEASCAPRLGQPKGTLDPCSFESLGPVTIPSIGLEGWL